MTDEPKLQDGDKEAACAGPHVDAFDCPIHDPRKFNLDGSPRLAASPVVQSAQQYDKAIKDAAADGRPYNFFTHCSDEPAVQSEPPKIIINDTVTLYRDPNNPDHLSDTPFVPVPSRESMLPELEKDERDPEDVVRQCMAYKRWDTEWMEDVCTVPVECLESTLSALTAARAQVAEQSEEFNAISKAIGRPLISAKPLLAGVMELEAQVALLQQQEPAATAWERGQIAMRDDLARMLDDQIEWVSIHGSIRNAAPLPYAPPEKETGV